MTVPMEVENEIRVLHFGEHFPVGTIASQLTVHEDVVKRVLGLLARRPSAKPRPLAVDPVKDFIAETLASYPRLCSTRLFDMVQPRGYRGSVRTLRDYVRLVRPQPKREAFLRLVPLIGEQAQVDWAHIGGVSVPGGNRDLWLFVMTLPWSRGMWGEFVFDLSAWSLLRSLARACAAFGGTAREWLFDNPKSVVLARHGAAACFQPTLLELSGRYAVRLKLCTPRKANQKGGVERQIRYLRERFLAARVIHGVEQGNRELAAFIADIAHRRPHPTIPDRTVGNCIEEERTRLLRLPEPTPCTDQVVPVRVDKTAFCRFDTNLYSVGPEHVGKTLTLAADDREVRFIEGTTLVARHERCWGRRQVVESPEHRAALVAQKHGASEGKGRDRLLTAVPAITTLYERWVERGRNLGSMTARTLKLLDLYGQQSLACAVAQVIERGLHDPGALASLCEQQRCALSAPVPIAFTLAGHVHDRDVIPHDLETYDAKQQ
jgi:transposase